MSNATFEVKKHQPKFKCRSLIIWQKCIWREENAYVLCTHYSFAFATCFSDRQCPLRGGQTLSFQSTRVAYSDHSNIPVCGFGSAKPDFLRPNSTESNLFYHGETTYRDGWMIWICYYSHALERRCLEEKGRARIFCPRSGSAKATAAGRFSLLAIPENASRLAIGYYRRYRILWLPRDQSQGVSSHKTIIG